MLNQIYSGPRGGRKLVALKKRVCEIHIIAWKCRLVA